MKPTIRFLTLICLAALPICGGLTAQSSTLGGGLEIEPIEYSPLKYCTFGGAGDVETVEVWFDESKGCTTDTFTSIHHYKNGTTKKTISASGNAPWGAIDFGAKGCCTIA
jgi:hypothetical protein